MKTLLFALAACLLSAPLSADDGPRPRRQPWRGFSHPAYLGALPRRPKQRVLDSLARAARHRQPTRSAAK